MPTASQLPCDRDWVPVCWPGSTPACAGSAPVGPGPAGDRGRAVSVQTPIQHPVCVWDGGRDGEL